MERVFLVAYTTNENIAKSSTVTSIEEYKRIGVPALKHFSELVERKTKDKVQYVLNIQELGQFCEGEISDFPY